MRSDGSGEPQQLLASQYNICPWSFSPDGRRLAYYEGNPKTGADIWTITLDTSDPDHPKVGKPEPFLATPLNEWGPMFSPDGRWIAYGSDESGTQEVYVRPFPAGRGGKWQISNSGGTYRGRTRSLPQRMRKFWHAEARARVVAARAEQQPALQPIATPAGAGAPVKASGSTRRRRLPWPMPRMVSCATRSMPS